LLLVGYDVASAAKASRIELRDGTVFEDAAYRLDNTHKIVVIRMGYRKRSVSFTGISRILDKEGKDVTASCLGDHYRPPGTQDSAQTGLQTTPEAVGRKKQPFVLAFRGGINLRKPSGAWYEGNTSSVGLCGDLVVALSRKMALRLTVSKSGTSYDSRELVGRVTVLEENLSSHVWRYFISVQAYGWPHWREDGRTMRYVFVGLGAVTHSLTGTALTADSDGDVRGVRGAGRTQSRFATTAGCGLVHMVSRTIGLEVGTVLDAVYYGDNSDDYASIGSGWVRAFLFDLRVGLVFMIR
jgi:hypothetical protein